jgi:enoyl-CoA hydratase/carnithine racemase
MWPTSPRALRPVTESLPPGSYRAGAGRAEAFLLNPQPLTARTAHEWGVVAEVVPNGQAVSRVREVGYGLSLEGASAADLVKSMQAKTEPVAQKRRYA